MTAQRSRGTLTRVVPFWAHDTESTNKQGEMIRLWIISNDVVAYNSLFPVQGTYYPMVRNAYPTRVDYFLVPRALANSGSLETPFAVGGLADSCQHIQSMYRLDQVPIGMRAFIVLEYLERHFLADRSWHYCQSRQAYGGPGRTFFVLDLPSGPSRTRMSGEGGPAALHWGYNMMLFPKD